MPSSATVFTKQTQLHLQRLMALHTIDMAISASVDLGVTLNVLLDQLPPSFRWMRPISWCWIPTPKPCTARRAAAPDWVSWRVAVGASGRAWPARQCWNGASCTFRTWP